MQERSMLRLVRVENENDFKEEKDVGARLLPKLAFMTQIACLILFLGLVYYLAQYLLTDKTPSLSAMGIALSIIVFSLALCVTLDKKNEMLNQEQANKAEGSKIFQPLVEIIEEGETSDKVVPFPTEKKALKKKRIYGRCREQEETKTKKKLRKKDKPAKRRDYYADYKSEQQGNVVMFKQKRPSFQRGAYRSIRPRMATAVNRIKWGTQTQTVNQNILRRCLH